MRAIALVSFAAAAFLVASCGGDQGENGAVQPRDGSLVSSSPLYSPRVVIVEEPLWPVNRARSLETLMLDAEVVIVQIAGVTVPYDPRPGYLGVPTSDPDETPPLNKPVYTPTDEERGRPPGRTYTVYAATVRERGSTLTRPGETIYIGQSGGTWDGLVYQDAGNPLLVEGHTYLMGLQPNAPELAGLVDGRGYWVAPPFTRFVVDESGTLLPVDDSWSDMPAVRELTGLTAKDAMARIAATGAGVEKETVSQ